MTIRQMLAKTIRFIFTTNSAIWFELDLRKTNSTPEADIQIKIDDSSLEIAMDWLNKQKKSWVLHRQEFEIAQEFNHYWPYASFNGEIIGTIKLGFNKVYITDFEKMVKLPAKVAFIYDTYVLKKYRGHGVAKQLIANVANIAKQKGYEKLGCHIPSWNTSSIHAYKANGFKKLNITRYIRLFGIKFRIIKSRNKKISIKKVGVPYD